KEAEADYEQQVNEAEEYFKSLKQTIQSIEQIQVLKMLRHDLVERISSIRLAEKKWTNSKRLAEKCVKIGKEYTELGKSPFKAGGRNQDDKKEDKDGELNCSLCMQLPDRPVTTPCGHNFCLKCFLKWVGRGYQICAKCCCPIPPKMASEPRINSAVVIAVRMARMSRSSNVVGPSKVQHFVHNQNKPDKAYMAERAKKTGKANASSAKIFVTTAPDHFGPILAENDPHRKQGVLVGESWKDRMECRQWGAHLPHVAGVAGQSGHGAQSVALSGGYEDDEDHGEWFLYTGSGGRESFDQEFVKLNEALRLSCRKGYPVRVVRSHKEKRSSYAPETGVRYDGVYRIEKCWRKIGIQGFKVCRYLFVRCDNEPAPWISDEHGDRPRPLPVIKELKQATDITVRKAQPSWDYDEEEGCWKWKKSPPLSRKDDRHNEVNDTAKDGQMKSETPKRGAKRLQTPANETETELASKRRKTMDHVCTGNGVRTRSMRSKEL
ncbi:hypothetical protein MKW94_011369, partial [Papaver nudicaule]|nr:hypothetical protein [Papaver nudicaule]